LFRAGAKVGTAKVQLGDDGEVDLVAPRNLAVTVPAGLADSPTKLKVRYQGPVKAPIAKGQHVADLVVTTADTPPQVVPLVAGKAIDEAGFFGRIWLGFKQLVGMA
jgi:D-alanyl-D-alanine carboxypeptidase (penicillin-binding protein 5/6)